MKNEALLIFDREPITNVLFNMVLDRREKAKPEYHGCFKPAIELASKLLQIDLPNKLCALQLVFLSDGKPGHGDGKAALAEIAQMARTFGDRLSVGTIGFGPFNDFSFLEDMALESTNLGSKGIFQKSELNPLNLSQVVNTLATNLTTNKTRLLGSTRTVRQVEKEPPQLDASRLDHEGWRVYTGVSRKVWSLEGKCWLDRPMMNPNATGVAMRKNIFGEGAERIVCFSNQ